MISVRKKEGAFSPYTSQIILDLGEKVFALKRENEQGSVYFIVNVDSKETIVPAPQSGKDLLTNKEINNNITLAPYEFVWVK
ncbi:hypothetical protein D3C76_786210 [compost metagenome]